MNYPINNPLVIPSTPFQPVQSHTKVMIKTKQQQQKLPIV